jgi:two-component system, OmpR family, KDP operon response regulator KdpE
MSKEREILIIEDEEQLQKLLRITLETNGFKITIVGKGKEGLLSAKTHVPNLVLLDLGLPDISGQDVLMQLRKWYSLPILILSAQNSEEEIVRALDNGANDYLVKPFRTGELIARIQAALRSAVTGSLKKYINAHLQVDFDTRQVWQGSEVVHLTSIEYKLLELFINNEDRVLTHAQLLREIWGVAHEEQTQNLRVFIAQLRKKIEGKHTAYSLIVTESGVGYRFKRIN